MTDHAQLSRRERQIMEAIYARGEGSATHVLKAIHDPPSRAAVRTFLRILEEKGHLTHRQVGREYIYTPTRPRKRAGRSALQRVLEIFYEGSLEQAVAAHLSDPQSELSADELKRIEGLINQARKRGR